jgi:PAS domain S-box-containing protein
MREMSGVGTDAAPFERLVEAARKRHPYRPSRREALTRVTLIAGFVAAALALLLLAGAHRHPVWWAYPLTAVAFALASLVQFEVATGVALPNAVVIVPALFALPAPSFPVVVFCGALLAGIVEAPLRHRPLIRTTLARASSCWWAFGPALVFLAAGEPRPDARGAWVMVVALVAQVGVDFVASTIAEWFALGVSPRQLVRPFATVFTIDVLLAPIGFLAAAAQQTVRWTVLLPAPLVALLMVFARERRSSLDRVLGLVDEVQDREERFRQLATAVPEVFFLFGVAPPEALYVSPSYEAVWGRSPASALRSADAWREGIHPDDVRRVRKELDGSTLGVVESSYRVVRPDGEVRWVVHQLFPIRQPDGAVVRVAGVARDLSEQRTLEEQLRQSQKMEAIGQLAGGVAHDFNNLLTAISGYAELALLSVDDPEPRSHLQEITGAASRAAELTSQILAFSRRQLLQPEVVDLNEVARETERLVRGVIGPGVAMRLDLDDDLDCVLADYGQLGQVVMNLALNAHDAMSVAGVLTIRTENVHLAETEARDLFGASPGPYVRLTVLDTGVGMDAETRRRIFEPFFTTKEPGKGAGLGLSTCYGIVKQSGGYIDVESEVGRGAAVTVTLPATDERRPHDSNTDRPDERRHAGAHVLLVEDEPIVRELTREMLGRVGLRVDAVTSPGDAIAAWAAHDYDVVVTDMAMPDLSGRELVDRLAAVGKPLRVVFLSGYAATSLDPGLVESAHFVQKPFTSTELVAAVLAALDTISYSSSS